MVRHNFTVDGTSVLWLTGIIGTLRDMANDVIFYIIIKVLSRLV
jgi:hypothetical protein